MDKAFDFLSIHKDVAFATVEQDKPEIRVADTRHVGKTAVHDVGIA